MNVNNYVNLTIRKLECGRTRKAAIREEINNYINTRLEKGEKIDMILARMGTASEIADKYNDKIPQAERRRHRMLRILKFNICLVIILALIVLAIYFLVPRQISMEGSEYFDEVTIESLSGRTLELLNAEDYPALREMSCESMQSTMTKESWDEARAGLCEDWGECLHVGTIYSTEMIQGGKHYAMTQFDVEYENISVTYQISFDTDMQISGIYVK